MVKAKHGLARENIGCGSSILNCAILDLYFQNDSVKIIDLTIIIVKSSTLLLSLG